MTDRQAIADALQRLAGLAEQVAYFAPQVGRLLVMSWAITLGIWMLNTFLRIRAIKSVEPPRFHDGPEVR